MLRNYQFGPLKHPTPEKIASLAIRAPYSSRSIWSLPPKTVAHFAGELSKVMLEAVEQYVFEKTLDAAVKNFQREAWRGTAANGHARPPEDH